VLVGVHDYQLRPVDLGAARQNPIPVVNAAGNAGLVIGWLADCNEELAELSR